MCAALVTALLCKPAVGYFYRAAKTEVCKCKRCLFASITYCKGCKGSGYPSAHVTSAQALLSRTAATTKGSCPVSAQRRSQGKVRRPCQCLEPAALQKPPEVASAKKLGAHIGRILGAWSLTQDDRSIVH